MSPLPQQCLLPQEPYLYFPTAAAVSAPAGALSILLPTAAAVSAPAGALTIFVPHCRNSVFSRLLRSSTMPQQYTL